MHLLEVNDIVVEQKCSKDFYFLASNIRIRMQKGPGIICSITNPFREKTTNRIARVERNHYWWKGGGGDGGGS